MRQIVLWRADLALGAGTASSYRNTLSVTCRPSSRIMEKQTRIPVGQILRPIEAAATAAAGKHDQQRRSFEAASEQNIRDLTNISACHYGCDLPADCNRIRGNGFMTTASPLESVFRAVRRRAWRRTLSRTVVAGRLRGSSKTTGNLSDRLVTRLSVLSPFTRRAGALVNTQGS